MLFPTVGAFVPQSGDIASDGSSTLAYAIRRSKVNYMSVLDMRFKAIIIRQTWGASFRQIAAPIIEYWSETLLQLL